MSRAGYQREWRRRNRLKTKHYNLKHRFGITLEERNAILEAQGNVCALCESTSPKWRFDWIVDHCHKTKAIRGILCNDCNTLLGKVNDNIDKLYRIIEYLQNHLEIYGK